MPSTSPSQPAASAGQPTRPLWAAAIGVLAAMVLQQAMAAEPVAGAAPPPVRAPEVSAPNTAQAETAPPVAQPPAAATAPKPVKPCSVCGHVESVRKVERSKPTTGVGAVGGAVVGGVLGNQIGSGRGRTVATVAGAVGGGFAGNAVEKKTRKDTVYQVSVRMQDGSLRTVETATAPPVGKAVTLQGNVLKPANGKK